jgi:hypothetical protein
MSGPQYTHTDHPWITRYALAVLQHSRWLSIWCQKGCWLVSSSNGCSGYVPGLSGGLQSLLLDPSTLSSLYGAMGTSSGALLALSQLPGINMEAIQVMPYPGVTEMVPDSILDYCSVTASHSCCHSFAGRAVRAVLEDSLQMTYMMLPSLMCMGASLTDAKSCIQGKKRCAYAGRKCAWPEPGPCRIYRRKCCNLDALAERSPAVMLHMYSTAVMTSLKRKMLVRDCLC